VKYTMAYACVSHPIRPTEVISVREKRGDVSSIPPAPTIVLSSHPTCVASTWALLDRPGGWERAPCALTGTVGQQSQHVERNAVHTECCLEHHHYGVSLRWLILQPISACSLQAIEVMGSLTTAASHDGHRTL
jgi:hypothetical protein